MKVFWSERSGARRDARCRLVACAGPAQAHRCPAADPAVITTWDAIAAPHDGRRHRRRPLHPTWIQLNLGMMSAAVYDAVVAIEGGYAPYGGRLDVHGRRHASSQAAAATAAYRILTTNFPPFAANWRRLPDLAGLDPRRPRQGPRHRRRGGRGGADRAAAPG